MTSSDLATLLGRQRLLPLFTRERADEASAAALALAAGGAGVLELTNRVAGAPTIFEAVVGALSERAPQTVVGAGTVFDAATAVTFLDRGARFIVSPTFDAATRETCAQRGVPYIPGCFTPTEVRRAEEAGCELVKLFPAVGAGPAHLKAVRAVFPQLRFVPTGGIRASREAVVPWLQAGATAVGLGSDLVAAGDSPEEIRTRLASLLAALRTASPDQGARSRGGGR